MKYAAEGIQKIMNPDRTRSAENAKQIAALVMRNGQRRVSLAEMSQQAEGVLRRATYDEFDAAASPTFDELTESLFFSPGDGRIWLNDQRMFLLHTASFGALRQELIEILGVEGARE